MIQEDNLINYNRHSILIDQQSLNCGSLCQAFSFVNEGDPYNSSLSYHMLTGRRGVEIISSNRAVGIIARHPNASDSDILFFPDNKVSIDIVSAFLDATRCDGALTIGRVPADISDVTAALLSQKFGNKYTFSAVDEEILDWKYPVHTLSTEAVYRHTGHQFKDFRKNIARARSSSITHRSIVDKNDALILRAIAQKWAKSRNHNLGEEYVRDLEPYTWLATSIVSGILALDGRIVFESGQPVAFILWEKDSKQGVSCSIASLSATSHKGYNEYLYFLMCQDLFEKGIIKVCIGGSETDGLDRFKRKMNPVISTQLKTIAILPK